MLPRTLEPEVMDSREEAVDYDGMDHDAVNRVFVEELLDVLVAPATDDLRGKLEILDAGTGTAQIPIELARRHDGCRILGIDLAAEMLALARRNVRQAGFETMIEVALVDAKAMPFAEHRFDVVISNSIVHHVPDPTVVVAEMTRVLKPGGLLFVRDLLRPPDLGTLDSLVSEYTGQESPHARQMFRDSLHAALTLEEIQTLLAELGRPKQWASQTTDRHWTICGRPT